MSKVFDLRKIRSQLPTGSIKIIAQECGITPRQVSDVLVRGWLPQHRNAVVASSLNLIRSKAPDGTLLKEAEKLNLASNYTPVTFKKKTRVYSPPEFDEPTREDLEELDEDELNELQELWNFQYSWGVRNFGGKDEMIDELCEMLGIEDEEDEDEEDESEEDDFIE